MRMTNKEMNQLVHWAGRAQCELMRLRQLAEEHWEAVNSEALTSVCRAASSVIAEFVKEATR